MLQDKKYFCYEIYKNLAVWSSNEKISYSPCSYFDGVISTSNKLDISEVWNGKEHQKLKQLIKDDKPIPQCHRCYHEEQHGLKSRRLQSKEMYEQYRNNSDIELVSPESIDYSVGNLCNLKCVICGPNSSTAWISDYQQMYPQANIVKFKHEKYNQIKLDNPKVLSEIKNIHFHGGGDPLLSTTHIDLLDQIKSVKGLSDLRIFYNVNGTVRVSDRVLQLWSECQLVELYFSIDDVNERFEYQRTGATWDEITNNLRWYIDNMPVNHLFYVNCVWSYLNLFNLNELVDWHRDNFSYNRLGDHIDLLFQKASGVCSIDHLSTESKNKLKIKFKEYPQLLELINSLKDSNESHSKFLNYINQLDKIRDKSFNDICPTVTELLI
jgi:MoaA/NifB/PqqE/SkfB family radical SAM enzyme